MLMPYRLILTLAYMALLIGDENPSPNEEYLYVFCVPTAPVIISGELLEICDMFCEKE
jgi:hypothetical protein